MMNMVLSYQCCMVPMNNFATLRSCAKKTNLCFSTPLLLRHQKMPPITGSLSASPTKAAHVSESHPLMMIEPIKKDKDGKSLCRFYDYVNEKVVNTTTKIPDQVKHAIFIGSSHGWLAFVSRLDCSVFLWSPFTTSPLISLPPIHTTLPSISSVIPHEELDEETAYESDDDFVFKVKNEYPGQSRRYAKRLRHIIRKIVFSSVPTSDDCIIVAVSNLMNTSRNIAFCKPGDKSWTFIKLPSKKCFMDIEDIIHFKDQLFYAVSNYGDTLYAYDFADLSSPKRYHVKTSKEVDCLSSLKEYEGWREERYYLVESLGDLLRVRRLITNNRTCDGIGKFNFYERHSIRPDKTLMFDVDRLDFSRNTWERTKCIGDQVLFLGTNQSLSLSAWDFPSLKANCIYFTDDSCKINEVNPPYWFPDFGHYELGGLASGETRFAHHPEGLASGEIKFVHHPEGFWVMRNFH